MAFGKANATASNIGPKLLDATPANYTSLGSLIDPTKPDVRDLYIQTFGDQGITGLLDVTGAKRSAGQADEVHWYEEGRMNRKLKGTASSGTVTLVDGHGYTASSMTSDQVVQVNDVLVAENGERLIVTGGITGDAFTVKQMTDVAATDFTSKDMVIID